MCGHVYYKHMNMQRFPPEQTFATDGSWKPFCSSPDRSASFFLCSLSTAFVKSSTWSYDSGKVISVTVQGHNKVISGTVQGRNNARLKTILRKPFRTF